MRTSDTGDTDVLLDTENLFRGFRAGREPIDRERGRLVRHFPAVTPEVSVALGALAAHDLVDWMEARFHLQVRRSFGQPWDPGVEATREALEVRGFTHHDVPSGKNKADLAVIEALTTLVGAGDGGHVVLGGEDNLVLDAAVAFRQRSTVAWAFLVVMPDSKTQQRNKFDPGGAYEGLEASALDIILAECRQLRRTNGSRRAQQRRLALNLRRHIRLQLSNQNESRSFGQAIIAICTSGQLPTPDSPPTQYWMNATASKLAELGLSGPIAHSLVSWVGEFQDYAAWSPHEALLAAVIDVFGGDEFDPRTAQATRTYVATHHPDYLTALERAIARSLP